MHTHQLGRDDAEQFLLFRARGLSGDPNAFRVTPQDDATLALNAWRSRLARDYVVAVTGQNGDWLGIGGLSQIDGEKLRHKGLIWGMYVDPVARGTGAADQIMQALVKHAIGKLRQLQLTVMADNQRARSFYERHRFSTYAIEPNSVRRDDEYADEALMQRLL